MKLIDFNNGDLILNWDDIVDKEVRLNLELRNKVFQELKDKYYDVKINTDVLYEMNKYAINRILQEKKNV